MIIRFIGHMCHVADGANMFAVLFEVTSHVPRFIVIAGDIEGSTDDPSDIKCQEIRGHQISFSTTGTTPTSIDLSGLVPVPSLSILGGLGLNLHNDIQTPKPGGNFSAFVHIPKGSYAIEDWFPKEATFNGKDYFCLPRVITFDAPSTDVFKVAGLPNGPMTLKKDAEVTITNLEQVVTGAHFDLHGTLFHPPIASATIKRPIEGTGACSKNPQADPPDVPECPNTGQQDLSVECSNTRYP